MDKRTQTRRVASRLKATEVHVWKFGLQLTTAGMERLQSYLSPSELGRAMQLARPLQRSRAVAARGRLRELLANYTDQAPVEIKFGYGAHGKPFLKNPGRGPEVLFNLSHSGDVALLAVTCGREVGIDVEYVKPERDYDAVAQFCLSERERSQLAALPAGIRREAFFHGWVRKEAFIKALGLGLAFPLDGFSVSLNPATASLLEIRGERRAAGEWQVIKLRLDGPFTAALAVEAGITNVELFDLTDGERDE